MDQSHVFMLITIPQTLIVTTLHSAKFNILKKRNVPYSAGLIPHIRDSVIPKMKKCNILQNVAQIDNGWIFITHKSSKTYYKIRGA